MSKKKRKRQHKKPYEDSKERETWVGYYERKTKTKREKEISKEEKYKSYLKEDEYEL